MDFCELIDGLFAISWGDGGGMDVCGVEAARGLDARVECCSEGKVAAETDAE